MNVATDPTILLPLSTCEKYNSASQFLAAPVTTNILLPLILTAVFFISTVIEIAEYSTPSTNANGPGGMVNPVGEGSVEEHIYIIASNY